MSKPQTAKNGSKPTTATPPPAAPAPAPSAESAEPTKPHTNVTRDNSFLKWKPSTLTRLQHVKERFPEVSAECDKLIAKVMTLPDNYVANPENVKLEVGNVVRLPKHDSMLKALKLENRGVVVSVGRGNAVVKVGEHQFTVLSRDVEILARK